MCNHSEVVCHENIFHNYPLKIQQQGQQQKHTAAGGGNDVIMRDCLESNNTQTLKLRGRSNEMHAQHTTCITWGMILIELDNFEKLLEIIEFGRNELIEIIQNLIDDSLEYQNQYVKHMREGQFVLITPVDIMITPQEIKTVENKRRNSMNNGNINICEDEYFYDKKEDRLRDIASSVLQHLKQEEEGLEFCMGLALKDRVSSDQEWLKMARQSLQEMKAYRDFDRLRRQKSGQQHIQMTEEHNDDDSESVKNLFSAINMVSDLNYQDENGDTALTIACGSRRHLSAANNNDDRANIRVIDAIIENGCDINLRNKEGMTALMFAAMYGENEVVDRLCKLGANLEVKGITSEYSKTALLFAAERGHKNVVEILLNYNANINAICDDGEYSILMLSVNNNHIDLIRYLLNYNQQNGNLLNINQQNKYGNTALIFAACNGNQYVVDLLINYGADTKIRNKLNETAHTIARRENHIKVCQMLLEKQQSNQFRISPLHKCDICGDSFKHKNNLEIHKVIHTQQALSCTYCNKKFARIAGLQRHVKVHQDRAGGNLSHNEIGMNALRQKAEVLAERTILENFQFRDKLSRRCLEINKLQSLYVQNANISTINNQTQNNQINGIMHISPQQTNWMQTNQSNSRIGSVDFQEIKRKGYPYYCPFCEGLTFRVWAQWKQHWYNKHTNQYFDRNQIDNL